jgi:GAF domain-containing protein
VVPVALPPAVPAAPQLSPEERARALKPRPAPTGGARLEGDELLTDLFEAMAELHFLGDAIEGADFVLAQAMAKLPCEVGLVSLFDMANREYVVVRQIGGKRSGLLLRLAQHGKLAQSAMRYSRAVVVVDASRQRDQVDRRWREIGVTLRSLVCAPVELDGRYLGLIELGNPIDGRPFRETDGHALTYMGRQFAEFVADRGVVTDPERVLEGLDGEAP